MKFLQDRATRRIRPWLSLTLGLAAVCLVCIGAMATRHVPKLHKIDLAAIERPATPTVRKAPARAQSLASAEDFCGTYEWTYCEYGSSSETSATAKISLDNETGNLSVNFMPVYSYGLQISFTCSAIPDASNGEISIASGQQCEVAEVGMTSTLLFCRVSEDGSVQNLDSAAASFSDGKLTFAEDVIMGLYHQGETEEETGFYLLVDHNVLTKEGYVEPTPQPETVTYTITPDGSAFTVDSYIYEGTENSYIHNTFSFDDGNSAKVSVYTDASASPASDITKYPNLRWYAKTRLTIDAPKGYLIKKVTVVLASSSKGTTFTSNCGGTVTDAAAASAGNKIVWTADGNGVEQFSATTAAQIRISSIDIEVVKKSEEPPVSTTSRVYFKLPGTEMAPTIGYETANEDGTVSSFNEVMAQLAEDPDYFYYYLPAGASKLSFTYVTTNDMGEIEEALVEFDNVRDGYAYAPDGSSWLYGSSQPVEPEKPYYLVGEITGWNPADEDYRFHRDSATGKYRLQCSGNWDTKSEFKINDGSWGENWGMTIGSTTVIPGADNINYLVQDGANMTLSEPIKNPLFIFDPEKATLTVTVGSAPSGILYELCYGYDEYGTVTRRRLTESEDGWTTTLHLDACSISIKQTNSTTGTSVQFGPATATEINLTPGEQSTYTVNLTQTDELLALPAGTYTFTLISTGDSFALTINAIGDYPPVVLDANIVYFDNSDSKWDTPYIYWWTSDGVEAGGGWPGESMIRIEGTDYWFYLLPGDQVGIIFNNNGGSQTNDITGSDIVYNHIYRCDSSYFSSHKQYAGPEPDITPYLTALILDDAEWTILCSIAESLAARGMSQPWDMSCGAAKAYKLDGVTVKDKHVVALQLRSRGISGTFPAEILTLPALKTLDLSYNSLEGKIDDAVAAIAAAPAAYPSAATLQVLKLSYNSLSGNLGLLGQVLPALADFDASHNRFADIYPALPATLTDLDISGQTIDRVIDVDFTSLNLEELFKQIPTLVLYDNYSHSYTQNISLNATNPATGSTLYLSYDGTYLYLSTYGEGYRGESGDHLNVDCSGSTAYSVQFGMTLSFAVGDSNFDGIISVADLQATVNHVFDPYSYLFNFTAADTYRDDQINVQDVVCTVNLLLASNTEAVASRRRAPGAGAAAPQARVYVRGSELVLETAVEIAAIQVKALGDITWTSPVAGMSFASDGSGMVGYSLSGATFVPGTHVIGQCDPTCVIAAVDAADPHAQTVHIAAGSGSVSGITSAVTDSDDTPSAIYDIYGRSLPASRRGVNIVVKDGRAVKVFNR